MKEKIIFFGAGPYILPIIESLNREFELALVVTTQTSGPVPTFCKTNAIPFASVSSPSEIINNLQSIINCRVAVLASFGMIIPDEVLSLFKYGIINVHPSLLPKYRGPTPVQSAILNGDETTGVSIIKLDAQVDHGPILCMIDHTVSDADTSDSLYKTLFKKGAELLVRELPKYLSGELKPTEQDHSKATFTEPLTRESGFIDFSKEPRANSQELDRMIRAYFPWPGVWFKAKLNGNEKKIKLLPEQKIQVEGKNIMTFKDFANGYPEGKEILEKLGL